MAKKGESLLSVVVEAPKVETLEVSLRGCPGTAYVPNRARPLPPKLPGKRKMVPVLTEDDKRQIAEDCLYRDERGRVVIPAVAVARAFESAASRYVDGVNRVYMAGAVRFGPPDLPILDPKSGKPYGSGGWVIDERVGRRPARKTPATIHRPRFDEWSVKLQITLDTGKIRAQQVLAVLACAGLSVGIGDGRVEKSGPFGGMFRVE